MAADFSSSALSDPNNTSLCHGQGQHRPGWGGGGVGGLREPCTAGRGAGTEVEIPAPKSHYQVEIHCDLTENMQPPPEA